MAKPEQLELFPSQVLPDGLVYRPDFISIEQERELMEEIRRIQFSEVKMHGVVARRHTQHFGLSYSYESRQVQTGIPIPDFLLALREQLRELTSIEPSEFVEVLVSEYPTGAGIGWHRDAPAFGIVAGISLLSECRMRFRPHPSASAAQSSDERIKPLVQILKPRSAYVLQGAVRWRWQHNIPPTEALRYSITFRTLRQAAA